MQNRTINASYNFNFKVPCSPAVSTAQMTYAQYINHTSTIMIISFEVNTYRPENIVDETSQSPWEELLVQ